jgi:hypothetical protein
MVGLAIVPGGRGEVNKQYRGEQVLPKERTMATVVKEVTNDELLHELKGISADLQDVKKSLAKMGAEVHVTHQEEKSIPTGKEWAGEKRP